MALQLPSLLPQPLPSILLVLVFAACAGTYRLWGRQKATSKPDVNEGDVSGDPYNSVRPIPNFKWNEESPIAFRPFKPKYNLSMSLENMTLDELVAVDKTYLDRINLRRQLMRDHPPSTVSYLPGSEAAIDEFYTWMTKVYLPKRFPDMYSLQYTEKEPSLKNLVTSESIPLVPSSTHSALTNLGSHVDTDFLFLLPSQDTGKYHLLAFVNSFPNGFSTVEKLGLPLAAIHTPVPGYAAKLEKSMDRFFAKIPLGRIVRRVNWSIATNDILFAESGTHFYDEDKSEETVEVSKPDVDEDMMRQKAEVVIENCRLRCERQTLHRLPQTKALVFAFKTYQYTLAEVKADGSGPELADAIEGLGKGNVPEMKFYKRGVVWGDKVREYMLG